MLGRSTGHTSWRRSTQGSRGPDHAVLGVGRTAIWRTRVAYLEGGVHHALLDVQRPGKPREYDTDVEARITALACSTLAVGPLVAELSIRDRPRSSAPLESGRSTEGKRTNNRLGEAGVAGAAPRSAAGLSCI